MSWPAHFRHSAQRKKKCLKCFMQMYAGPDFMNCILICPIKCVLLYNRITIMTIIAATFMQYTIPNHILNVALIAIFPVYKFLNW